jgi:hypothetical protein
VRGRDAVGLRDLEARVLLGAVLVPVVLHQSEQGVIGEARATDVAEHRRRLLRGRIEGVSEGLGERGGGARHPISIGPACDICRAPPPTEFAEAGLLNQLVRIRGLRDRRLQRRLARPVLVRAVTANLACADVTVAGPLSAVIRPGVMTQRRLSIHDLVLRRTSVVHR